MTRFANEHGFCELNPFPGCSQLVVSNHAFIYKEKRGKGFGTENHKLRVERATFMGYDYLMCTVVSVNEIQLKIMKSQCFKLLDSFKNKETGNLITIFGKQLNK
ncbi:MAG: hypothetical protein KUG81_08650 [Gammaproteobacteria bacterium]|nr:hypothetical protein [Gammaproteobacteria bacterium]